MTPTSRGRLISGLKLVGLGVLGIAFVTIPVTLALVFAAPPGNGSHAAAGPSVALQGPSRSSSAVTIRCMPTTGWYVLTLGGLPRCPGLEAVKP